ncbi:MAG TPA: TIM-barrel domain-containing protein, partial [Terriglobales bacterium]|nr:TIM-barrel domain-containing protein [Terriglobales bacterium]
MSPRWNRRDVLKGLIAASTAMLVPQRDGALSAQLQAPPVEIQVTPLGPATFRLSILAVNNGSVGDIPVDGSLVQQSWGSPIARLREEPAHAIAAGNLRLKISFRPVSIEVRNLQGDVLQQLAWDENAGVFSFLNGSLPLFGLGEGGPQFDRRGSTDPMRSGQGGYKLATHGGRVPVPWVIGTSGWAMFFHQPRGAFDFTGQRGKFQSASPGAALDLFFIGAADPPTIMAEYARLTGFAEMPPLWSLGYQQSHRTLASREDVLAEAKTFREKKLPCDAL